jgi:hypothetical protein
MDHGIPSHQNPSHQDFGDARGEVPAEIRRWNLLVPEQLS